MKLVLMFSLALTLALTLAPGELTATPGVAPTASRADEQPAIKPEALPDAQAEELQQREPGRLSVLIYYDGALELAEVHGKSVLFFQQLSNDLLIVETADPSEFEDALYTASFDVFAAITVNAPMAMQWAEYVPTDILAFGSIHPDSADEDVLVAQSVVPWEVYIESLSRSVPTGEAASLSSQWPGPLQPSVDIESAVPLAGRFLNPTGDPFVRDIKPVDPDDPMAALFCGPWPAVRVPWGWRLTDDVPIGGGATNCWYYEGSCRTRTCLFWITDWDCICRVTTWTVGPGVPCGVPPAGAKPTPSTQRPCYED